MDAQFGDRGAGGFVLSRECGDADAAGAAQIGTDVVQAFVQSSACTDVNERLVITNPSQGSSCVNTTTQVNRVVCCAAQACMENGGRDN
eukprot:COSAG02_NODE_62591_length_265_cov_0.933735_1_plen_88_part_11